MTPERQAAEKQVLVEDTLTALAAAAGATIAAAMATDTWGAARAGLARIFGRRSADERRQIEAQLDRHNAQVEAAADADAIRQRLSPAWGAEVEALLEAEPALADELGALIGAIDERLGRTRPMWIQQNVTVSGSHNITPVVGRGTVVLHSTE